VASHPSTARELGRVFRELRSAEHLLAALAPASRRAGDVVALYRRYRALTAGLFDETDLLDSAAASINVDGEGAQDTGAVVLYLPRQLPEPLARLLRSAATRRGAEPDAIIGLTEIRTSTRLLTRWRGRSPAGRWRLLPALCRLRNA
jgi:hypothetical protein